MLLEIYKQNINKMEIKTLEKINKVVKKILKLSEI